MNDDPKADRAPLTQDRDGPLGEQGWHAGATFFSESGGRPAEVEGRDEGPATEEGDPHLPASEADMAPIQNEEQGEPQSWAGSSFGSIPPPG